MISIVLPVFNEEELLSSALPAIFQDLAAWNEGLELVCVDNGSQDATASLLEEMARREPRLRVRRLPEPDYGDAAKAGLAAAQGDWRGVIDLDAWDLAFVSAAVGLLQEGAAVVLGDKVRPLDRRSALQRTATRLRRRLEAALFPELSGLDAHGPVMMDWRRCGRIVAGCRLGADLFKEEFLLRVRRADLPIRTVPLAAKPSRPSRTSLAGRGVRYLKGLISLYRGS